MFVTDEQEALADVLDGSRLAFDAGFAVFSQVLLDNLFHVVGHRGAEKGALGVCRDFL